MNADTEHPRIQEDLPILLGGAPAGERMVELRAHLVGCPGCAGRYWDLIDARDALLHAATEDPSPPDGAPILAGRMGLPPAGAPPAGRWRPILAAAAVLLALLAGWIAGPGAPSAPRSAGELSAAAPAISHSLIPTDAPVAVEQAYGEALTDPDQFSRALTFLSTMERDARRSDR